MDFLPDVSRIYKIPSGGTGYYGKIKVIGELFYQENSATFNTTDYHLYGVPGGITYLDWSPPQMPCSGAHFDLKLSEEPVLGKPVDLIAMVGLGEGCTSNNSTVKTRLTIPPMFEIIKGTANWEEELKPGQVAEIRTTIRAIGSGEWEIGCLTVLHGSVGDFEWHKLAGTVQESPAVVSFETPVEISSYGQPENPFSLAQVPQLGQDVDFSSEFPIPDRLLPSPIWKGTRINAWLEFERYDPDIYYPLGKGSAMDLTLRDTVLNNPKYDELVAAAAQQPQIIVPVSEVSQSGNLSWAHYGLISSNAKVSINGTLNFKTTGDYRIKAMYAADDNPPTMLSDYYFSVGKRSSTVWWPKDAYSNNGQAIDYETPLSVQIQGESPDSSQVVVTWTIGGNVTYGLREAHLELVSLTRRGEQVLPADQFLIAGNADWHGDLHGVPITNWALIEVPPKGDWMIRAWGRRNPEDPVNQTELIEVRK